MDKPLAPPRALFSNEDPLLNERQAAVYLGLTNPKTLALWRCVKRYPALTPTYIGKSVRYKRSVLDSFIASNTETVK